MRRSIVFRLRAPLLVGLLLTLSTSSPRAAVAPEYERMRQFSAALSVGSEAASRLGRYGLIDRIEAVGDYTFRFWARNCFAPVVLSIDPQPADSRGPLVGAATAYRASLGDVTCN
jgi:hypothetical protein